MTLVNTKTAATTSKIKPMVPVTVLVKYNIANTTATINRMILSVDPMFFFISLVLMFNNNDLFA